MKLKPIDTTVAVEIEKINDKSSGGIVLAEDYITKQQMNITEGILAAVGDFAFMEIQQGFYPRVGDKVYFKKFSGILHTDKETGKEYRLIADTDIYAVERKEEVKNA